MQLRKKQLKRERNARGGFKVPYFIFKMFPSRKVEAVESHEKYKDARAQARDMRKELTVADNFEVKIIMAANEHAGMKLLTTEREAIPWGDD